jgi:phosphonate transport system permease protein
MTATSSATWSNASTAPVLPRRPRRPGRTAAVVVLIALAGCGVWALVELGLVGQDWASSIANAERFLSQAIPLTFPPLSQLLTDSAETLGLVILGTLLASVISLPVAYLAAGNTTPGPVSRIVGRVIGVLARSVPDAILAMIFATMFTFGALPGILAIGLHSIGMISKLYADAIEQIDEGPRLAIRAAGGGRWQEFTSGVLPQTLPSFVATSLHRNDINLRGSIILGYVGVAGLGHDLSFALQELDYQTAIALAIVIFILCVLMEIVSSAIRARMLNATPTGRGLGDRIVRRYGRVPDPDRSARGFGTVEAAMHRPWTRRRIGSLSLGWGTVAVITASVIVCHITWSDFVDVWSKVPRTLERLWPPSFGNYLWSSQILPAWIETIAIALAATVLSVVFSLVLGSLAARNAAPNRFVRNLFRFVLVLIRGIPELVLAVVLITITGLGDQPAIIALAVGGVGLLGKLIADSMEEIPNGPGLAVLSGGSSRGQRFLAVTIPQSRPAIIGHTFYLLDTNLRAATILGLVGSGGLGFYLLNSARIAHYDEVFAILLLVIATVLVTELLAVWLRRALR